MQSISVVNWDTYKRFTSQRVSSQANSKMGNQRRCNRCAKWKLEVQNLDLLNIGENHSKNPIQVPVPANGQSLLMEVDTGVMSVISKDTKNLFPTVNVSNSPVMLQTYTGQWMKVYWEKCLFKCIFRIRIYSRTSLIVVLESL